MSDNDLREVLFREWDLINRLEKAENKDEEIAYQKEMIRDRMQAMGLMTDRL